MMQTVMTRMRLLLAFGLIIGGFWLALAGAQARDVGQWSNADPDLRNWYQALMQPDAPRASCCGDADAYWADEVHVRGGKVFATITDDRPDEPRGRPHVEIGTEIEIPPNKLKWGDGDPQTSAPIPRNMDGHGIVFLSRGGYVYCYVQPAGI